ncbi:MAG TPA: T9SS type A sorting domain-containing protein, partial [Cytophagales bacterium]|nr:T9SS type A sorting domain-containing protein [Cytophagales bacterium]
TGTTPSFRVYGQDNWVDNNKNGLYDAVRLTDYKTAKVESNPFAHAFDLSQALPAKDALQYLIQHVGASRVRDAVDALLIEELLSYGTKGRILTTEDDNGIIGNVGTVANGIPPRDTDKDGMPDDWERNRGLNPTTADDKGDDDNDGYTNVEEYLNCLVGEGDCMVTVVDDHSASTMTSVFPNPFQQHLNIHHKGRFIYLIFDTEGKEVVSGTAEGNVAVGHNLPAGMYMLKVRSEEGPIQSTLIFRQPY